MIRHDVETREDLIRVMTDLYDAALPDALIGHHFKDLHLAEHIPIVADFWEKALFGRPTYYRNAYAIHHSLHAREPMTAPHFVRWVEIFCAAVDKSFAGGSAEKLKLRARTIADAMSQGLNAPVDHHACPAAPPDAVYPSAVERNAET